MLVNGIMKNKMNSNKNKIKHSKPTQKSQHKKAITNCYWI